MRFNKLYEKKLNPEQTAVSSGVQTLGTDQWMGTYKWSKDVAGHDGNKQHAPESPSGNDVYTDKAIVVGYSDADDKMTKAAMKGKVKQTVGSGSEEPTTVNAKSPLSKNEDVSKGLPDHLKKHFDKDGNPIKGSWKDGKWTPNKDSKYQVKDVTPKGYGPNEDVSESSEIKVPTEDGITMQDIRLMAGEGKLTQKTIKQAIEVIRKQRKEKQTKLKEAQNIYHLNRTGFARGPRDSERHDLDVSRPAPQEWALKINGKVWSKDGKTVTFNSKEQALKVRQSLLAKRPELEVGLVTRGGTTESKNDTDVDSYADALIKRNKQNLNKGHVTNAARIAGVDEKQLMAAVNKKVGRIKEEAELDEDVGAQIADLIRKKNSASSPVARKNIDSQIAQLKRQRDKMNEEQGVAEGTDIDARISNLKDAIRFETPRSVPGEDHREQYARHAEKIAGYKAELKKLVAQKKQQGVAEGSLTEGQYEMMMRNGQVKKFIAKDDADAKRIAAGHGAKSVIRLKGGVPAGKVSEQGAAEGYTFTRGIDKERYQARNGLEGPFSTKSGKVVYYDKVEGKYYDPDTDMYIEYDDWQAMNEQGVAEGTPRVDSLVTKGLGLMRGPTWLDAVAAIKYQVGERDYRERKQFYDFFVRQLVDMYAKKDVAEAHGNSKIYDKCWTGYRKVPGKTRGEDGSCEKIKEDEVEEAEVRHDRYMRSHGKKASGGHGSWMFTNKEYGEPGDDETFTAPPGKFSDAAKHAKKWAKEKGHYSVYAMEDGLDEASTADMRAYFAQPLNQNPIKPSTDKRFPSKEAYLRWLQQQKKPTSKDSTVDEDVIYRLDKENPMSDTEVLVIGGAGRYSLDGLRAKARREAEQLAKDLTIDHGGAFRRSAQNVRQLQNTLNTIVAAYDELSQLRKLGGVRSKGIKDEDATVVREGLELMEKWTQKYKNSINCSDPKGFSQKAHCAGKKK